MKLNKFILISIISVFFVLWGSAPFSNALIDGHQNKKTDISIKFAEKNTVNINNDKLNNSTKPKKISLTLVKEIFGCEHIIRNDDYDTMDCSNLDKDSNLWINCADSKINYTPFCKNIPIHSINMEIINSYDNKTKHLNPYKKNTTIKIDQGDYLIRQVNHSNNYTDNLGKDIIFQDCISAGYAGHEFVFNEKKPTLYGLCIEYNDIDGKDCSKITVNTHGKKLCVVKKFVRYAIW